MKVKIIKCSKPFSWYEPLARLKSQKIFEVEIYNDPMCPELKYITLEPIALAGSNKGLFCENDVIVIKDEKIKQEIKEIKKESFFKRIFLCLKKINWKFK